MINAGELRPGSTVERGGDLLQVVDYAHVKQGRGSAFVRVKLRNLVSGAVTEETFRPEEKFGRARIERAEAQYLYRDGDNYVVMDSSTFDQFPVSPEVVGDARHYLKENDTLYLLRHEERVLGVELPITADLEIVYTEPGFRGDTATGGTKPATLETGHSIDVPLFVSTGDRVRVDTRTGRYIERATA